MDKKIVLIGGGGHCISVLDTLIRNGEYSEIVITDNDIPSGTVIMGCRVAGNDDVLPELLKDGFNDAFITVGSIKSTSLRRTLYEKAVNFGFSMPNIIDKSAVVSHYANLGNGIFIGKNAVVNAQVKVGNAAIINTCAIIEHECIVGAFAHVAVGAKICGNVKIGDDTFIGAGTVIIQKIEVGNNVIIGAGSTVIGKVNNDTTNMGLIR